MSEPTKETPTDPDKPLKTALAIMLIGWATTTLAITFLTRPAIGLLFAGATTFVFGLIAAWRIR